MDLGFPRRIVEDFPGVGPKVDAVFESFGKRTFILLAMGHLKHFMFLEGRELMQFLITGFL